MKFGSGWIQSPKLTSRPRLKQLISLDLNHNFVFLKASVKQVFQWDQMISPASVTLFITVLLPIIVYSDGVNLLKVVEGSYYNTNTSRSEMLTMSACHSRGLQFKSHLGTIF